MQSDGFITIVPEYIAREWRWAPLKKREDVMQLVAEEVAMPLWISWKISGHQNKLREVLN